MCLSPFFFNSFVKEVSVPSIGMPINFMCCGTGTLSRPVVLDDRRCTTLCAPPTSETNTNNKRISLFINRKFGNLATNIKHKQQTNQRLRPKRAVNVGFYEDVRPSDGHSAQRRAEKINHFRLFFRNQPFLVDFASAVAAVARGWSQRRARRARRGSSMRRIEA